VSYEYTLFMHGNNVWNVGANYFHCLLDVRTVVYSLITRRLSFENYGQHTRTFIHGSVHHNNILLYKSQ